MTKKMAKELVVIYDKGVHECGIMRFDNAERNISYTTKKGKLRIYEGDEWLATAPIDKVKYLIIDTRLCRMMEKR